MNNVLRIDAKGELGYTATCTINTSSKFDCTGGYTHDMKLMIGLPDGGSLRVNSFLVYNADGFFTYSEETRSNRGKAKMGFSAKKNPALLQLFDVVQTAVANECKRVGISDFAGYIAPANTKIVNGVEREYDDTMFVQLKLDGNSSGCGTILELDVPDNTGFRYILSNETFEDFGEGKVIIRQYVADSGFDQNFINFLKRIYGCNITVSGKSRKDKRSNIEPNTPGKFLTNRKLLSQSDFADAVTNKSVNTASFGVKCCFISTKANLTYCSLVSDRVKSSERVNTFQIMDDAWNQCVSQQKTEVVGEVEPSIDDIV